MNDLVAQAIVFLNSLWRPRNQALVVAWLVCLAAWAYIATLPNVYDSSARVYVDTRSILEPLLQGLAIDNNTGAEVAIMTSEADPLVLSSELATDLWGLIRRQVVCDE